MATGNPPATFWWFSQLSTTEPKTYPNDGSWVKNTFFFLKINRVFQNLDLCNSTISLKFHKISIHLQILHSFHPAWSERSPELRWYDSFGSWSRVVQNLFFWGDPQNTGWLRDKCGLLYGINTSFSDFLYSRPQQKIKVRILMISIIFWKGNAMHNKVRQ